ncbi:MAG: redox-regulated ATPase YchF [Candidatus Nealsonbacteria bacterium CG_4_9_14_0_2_um_filter_37_38]|uniref:Redox-regulated ATPase YchF n=1 Tax=Candidatus Nealsonbacteria bacterium CG_4_10_14_0_8_um_filter_37_14 TaxID=1974684 RepID=A0A2M7R738_9BACT|nr:MAG: redox-regulated ATPase YchF [Candidatus Nealsonbacteria bacterium CG11_big_fil_rev_8_21_14_0_20_37_68]PIW91865.1 MAG: redox-regulated ATPase YchF [Candidatus Nealsonbacteria bacterium CG_4_8_14_3_um_filter_37_23]PIY89201.1 MAG: redox-regulated ATPase YchF [Candidatus Nealsonbacteria bacterium CG_4_10_14_0_8_um_filter_37_14]PJC51607.1 MAG: redox-regulated ATPase YchF [Candidatus Nealsonbacteria bacterium CG_4_9_14_0_2_um_filter_37_38]
MGFSVGIVGLPNVGKSTLFKALTKKEVGIAPFPFTTIDPNVGVVEVPDQKLEKIAEVIRPKKVTPTFIEFIDIAGLVRGAHHGEGLGNQFLAQIRECDAILEVIRAFEKEGIPHVEKGINPARDIEIVKTELIMKDLETVEKALPKLEKEEKTGDKKTIKKLNLLKMLRENLSAQKQVLKMNLGTEDFSLIKEFQLLTAKPILYLLNIRGDDTSQSSFLKETRESFSNINYISLDLKFEEELSEMSEKEKIELGLLSKLDQLIVACYNILDLITFYTVAGGNEVRAWTLEASANILRAAEKVHSDFKEKFIRGEQISWEKLVESSAWTKAREKGWIQTVGKEYVVRNGDVIEFKI